MHISEEGFVAGSVNRAELAAAHDAATDEAVKANLAAVGAENGMYVEDGKLVDPSTLEPEPAPEPDAEPEPDLESGEPALEPEPNGRPAVNDPKAAWVDWAVAEGLDRNDAEALTKAELVDLYSDKE